jgi:hypothetical protein
MEWNRNVPSLDFAFIARSRMDPSAQSSPSVSFENVSSPVPMKIIEVAVVRCRNTFCRSINSAIPLRLIAVFLKGINLNDAFVELAHSSVGSHVSAEMSPSKIVSLCSLVVTTFKARVRSTSPSAIVWDNV